MKSTTTIRSVLGLSQEEISILLGITRTQWSMYEIGKRDIPLAAKQQLATLLTSVKKKKSVSKESLTIAEAEKKKDKEWLKKEYITQQHKQLLLERKINVMKNIRSECFAALEVAIHLESEPENKLLAGLAINIKNRVKNTLIKNSSHRLQEMQLKKESAEMLKKVLEQKIKEISNQL
jgi:transcriptional regulator with XRE-family HTH domain